MLFRVENQYTTQGKCGLALIGNESVHIYQLLLYKQKNDIISTSKVYNIFQFIMQKDNYASFCDDQKHNWTVRFNSESDMNEFVRALESKGVKIINNIKKVEKVKAKEIDVQKIDLFKETTVTDNPEASKHIDSDNQSDSSSSNAKANILSRMAKMGQRILLPNTSISDGTDSDTEKDKSLNNKVNRKSKRITPVPAVPSTNVSSEPPIQETSMVPNTAVTAVTAPVRQATTTQQYALINGQYVPIVQPHYLPVSTDIAPVCQAVIPAAEAVSSPVLYTPTAQLTSDQLNMYFVENRTHNSEVRMNIMRLTNKMEEMMDKVNKLDVNSTKTTSNVSNNDILKENEILKSNICMLEKNISEFKQHECKIKNQEELVERETVLLKEKEEQNKLLEQYRQKENEYLKKVEELQLQLNEQSQMIQNLEESLQKSVDNKNNSELLMNKEKFSNIDDTIKKIMNVLYQEVCSQFSDDESVQGKDVKKVLAQKIVDNTYSIIATVKELKMPETNVASSV